MLRRDSLASWIAYTPTYSAGTGVIGNGSTMGFWRVFGCNAQFIWRVLFGTTTSFEAAQVVAMTLPPGLVRMTGSHLGTTGRILGSAYFLDASAHANSRAGILTVGDGASTSIPIPVASTGQGATSTTPFTWANGDQIIAWGACPIEGF